MIRLMGETAAHVAAAAVESSVPGAVLAGGLGETTWITSAAGWADTTPRGSRPMLHDTLFDLASLTKVVATLPLVLSLVADGSVNLDDPVSAYLHGFTGGARHKVTLRNLLTHTSGLPATCELWLRCGEPVEATATLCRLPLEAEPGTLVAYSDVGFILLGSVVEEVTGESLDAAFAERISQPLALTRTRFGPLARGEEVAATERRRDGTAWKGVVHDENARFLGGVAGHAGLFSDAADMSRFAKWWISTDDGPVPAALRDTANRCGTGDLGGHRGLGWVCAGDQSYLPGRGWSAQAVSHTGFTGTSIALDPVTGMWVVLLTNAVHHGRDKRTVRKLREAVHSSLAAALGPETWNSASERRDARMADRRLGAD